MYVIRWSVHGHYANPHLFEMTAAEFREAKAADTITDENPDGDGVWHEHVSAATAHRHVRDDRVHSTPLYLDWEGRIRYARDGY